MNKRIILLLSIGMAFGQFYKVDDYVKDLGGTFCENGNLEWSYSPQESNEVIFIFSFATWWIPCQAESQEIENIFNSFKGKEVKIIGAGMDWGNPYSCKDWAEKFNLSFPLLDDSKGKRIYNYFGNGVVPYNVIIDRDGKIVYSKSGFNKDEIVDAIKKSLKRQKKENLLLEGKSIKKLRQTNYEKLLENKGLN